ncbi:flavin-containing monooxygenase [Paenibacillus montanisoli]|uniref:Oxidoreductase n=1 Tax=Paenibacillus montanisoli TaxID=2081970 RepID=A0A328U1I2_9BACL|nr:NAD(P)/FAD-dependent oxidoreductase [Paenibacillus montanisoli]RAP73864.1 oxidoreductase [Paenibacillus montanisoli]
MRHVEVLIIGSGQAGQALGYYLKRQKVSFMILGKEKRLGDTWRYRYDSLVLFTPRWFSSLPGLALKGDPNGYPSKDEIANYLENYANHFDLPVELGKTVISLEKIEDGFRAVTEDGEYLARKVVVATGPFQRPYIPSMAANAAEEVYHIHSSQYRNPSQLNPGSLLVVGSGNSGAQIAAELCHDRKVFLSAGHPIKHMPQQLLGKSIFLWLRKTGLLYAAADGWRGRWFQNQGDPIFGQELKRLIKQGKINMMPRAASMQGNRVTFDGSDIPLVVDNIIWATGFRSDYSWIRIPKLMDGSGNVIHHQGVTSVQGLYFLGLPWQRSRGSSLVGGVGLDAEMLSGML